MNEKELFKLKEKIDSAKSKAAELKGRQDYLMQQLKKDWDCKTVDEANELVEKMDAEIAELNKQIASGIKKIETQMEKEGL